MFQNSLVTPEVEPKTKKSIRKDTEGTGHWALSVYGKRTQAKLSYDEDRSYFFESRSEMPGVGDSH